LAITSSSVAAPPSDNEAWDEEHPRRLNANEAGLGEQAKLVAGVYYSAVQISTWPSRIFRLPSSSTLSVAPGWPAVPVSHTDAPAPW
jgi:hypothetical protein